MHGLGLVNINVNSNATLFYVMEIDRQPSVDFDYFLCSQDFTV